MKKAILFFTSFLLFSLASYTKTKTTYNKKNAIQDNASVLMADISAVELTKDMLTGWNLGNTLDANATNGLSSETSWGMIRTTKEMFEGLAKSGIKTVRIPVSWANHFIDDKYTIDPKWMSRVKQIVDWALESDLYVILNTHHDNCITSTYSGYGYYPDEDNFEKSRDFFANVWSQIARAFNNGYDQRLMFETMNEPRLRSTENEWNFNVNNSITVESQKIINKLNQVCLNAIRETGGNNANRVVIIAGYAATPSSVLSDVFELPKDKAENKLMVSVHMYTPYIFAGQSPGAIKFVPKMQNDYVATFKNLNKKFVQNGVGVFIGEYGATNKNNLEARVAWFSSFIKFSRKNNLVACVWDNNVWEVKGKDYSEKFGYYNRKDQTWYFPEILQAILDNVNNWE